jgi:hypothetical protein
MLSVAFFTVMLSSVVLNAVMLSVVAPPKRGQQTFGTCTIKFVTLVINSFKIVSASASEHSVTASLVKFTLLDT